MSDFNAIRFQPARPLLREISADRLNTILSEIKRNKPVGERGITVRQSGDRTYIGLAKNFESKTFSDTHPFQISVSVVEESYFATVRPGTVNGLLPTNTFSGANLRSFSVSANTLQYVSVTAQGNGSQLTSCQLSVSGSAQSPQTAALYSMPTQVSFLIGVIYNSSVYQVVKTNISVAGNELYRVAKTSPSPGEVAFDVYYAWA
jgi:hypothetical protein